jgi:hypothetical protein
MSGRVGRMLVECGLDDDGFDRVAELLETPPRLFAPTPSAALQALLTGGLAGVPSRRPRRAVAIGAALSLTLIGTGAAAADQLPRPLQRIVSSWTDSYLPFGMPSVLRHEIRGSAPVIVTHDPTERTGSESRTVVPVVDVHHLVRVTRDQPTRHEDGRGEATSSGDSSPSTSGEDSSSDRGFDSQDQNQTGSSSGSDGGDGGSNDGQTSGDGGQGDGSGSPTGESGDGGSGDGG